jgi:low temperature requirement protein LtrA
VEILIGSALAVLLAFGLWWAYFELLSPAAEKILARREGLARADIARDAYTYLHFPMIAGIIVAALGLELAMEHVAEPGPLGAFGGFALGIGIAVYLLATFFFWRRVSGKWAWPRLASGLLFLVVSPLFAIVPPLAALGVAVGVIALVVIVEWLAYHEMQVPD